MTQEQLKAELEVLEAQLKAFLEPKLQLVAELEGLEADVEKINDEIEKYNTELASLDRTISDLDTLKAEEQAKENPDAEVIAKIEAEIESLRAQEDSVQVSKKDAHESLDEAKVAADAKDQEIENWDIANGEELKAIQIEIDEVSSQIVMDEDKIWTGIGEALNAGLAKMDNDQNNAADELYFGAMGLTKESGDYAKSQLNRAESDYNEAFGILSEEHKRELRTIFNNAINEVFQVGDGDQPQMAELGLDDLFGRFIASGRNILDFLSTEVQTALTGFREFEKQQGEEGNTAIVTKEAFDLSLQMLNDSKAEVEERIVVTNEFITKITQKHEDYIISAKTELEELNVSLTKAKEAVEAQVQKVEDAIGTPGYVDAAKNLYELETEVLGIQTQINSLSRQIDNKAIEHNMTKTAAEVSLANYNTELTETNEEISSLGADLEKTKASYEEAKAEEEDGLAAVREKRDAYIAKAEEQTKVLKEEVAVASKAFDEVYTQWNAEPSDSPIKTSLYDEYMDAEGSLAAKEWELSKHESEKDLTVYLYDRDEEQHVSEIASYEMGLKMFNEIVVGE